MLLSTQKIREQFPFLKEGVIYLDSAATAQKPQCILDAMQKFYETENANVHRGVNELTEKATNAYENARKVVQKFINANYPEEIIFTKSCTESINLVAKTWGKKNLNEEDRVALTLLEHHSNIVPWLQLTEETGTEIDWIDIDDNGELQLKQLEEVLSKGNVKLLGITGQSNVLGIRPPLEEVIPMAHKAGALVLMDVAQLIAHHTVDVQKLDCDFLAFSGHKLYGPTGIGILYGKREILESIPPFLGGGGMIKEVAESYFTSADIPQKFEAGTPPIAQAVGLKAAIEWLSQFEWEDIEEHENKLIEKAIQELSSINGLTILPSTNQRTSELVNQRTISGCISFVIKDIHPHDLTDILGEKKIFMRAGHHCAMPLHKRLGVDASTRLSISIYNTEEEIAKVKHAIEEAMGIFK